MTSRNEQSKSFIDKSVFSLRQLSTRRYPHLLLSASASASACSTAPITQRAAIDRFLLPAWQLAANPPPAVAAVDRWDRQTDARRYEDPTPHSVGLERHLYWTLGQHKNTTSSVKNLLKHGKYFFLLNGQSVFCRATLC